MSHPPQRGRAAARGKKPSPMRMFYILLAVVAVIGVALVGLFATQNPTATTSQPVAAGATPAPSSGPTGRTPDGFYYKGSEDAKVVVTEYSDFQ